MKALRDAYYAQIVLLNREDPLGNPQNMTTGQQQADPDTLSGLSAKPEVEPEKESWHPDARDTDIQPRPGHLGPASVSVTSAVGSHTGADSLFPMS